MLMGNSSGGSVCGVGTVDLKFTSGKIVRLKNVHYVPSIKILLADLFCVEMATSLSLSQINCNIQVWNLCW